MGDQFRLRRDGANILVEARGDLDCDGKFSRFERVVAPDGAQPLTTQDELE
jgi:hypothetical protein